MLLNDGELDGVRLRVGVHGPYTKGRAPTLGEPGEFYWQGAWGTAFFIDPKKKLVAVLMLQVPLLQAPHYQLLFHNLVHQALVN